MGTSQIQRMKSLLFLVLLAFVRSEWTCEECEKVMKTVLESDISEEGIQQQVDILLAEVCPQLEDAETCVERLPQFWADLSPVMWTFAFQTDLWCGEVCPDKGLRDVTCGECVIGLENLFATFARAETVDWLMEYVSGPAFCESSEDPEPCKTAIETVSSTCNSGTGCYSKLRGRDFVL